MWNRPSNGDNPRRRGPGTDCLKEGARPQPRVEGLSKRTGQLLEATSLSLLEGHPEETDRDFPSSSTIGDLCREDLVLGAASDRHFHAFLGNCEVRFEGCTRAQRPPLEFLAEVAQCPADSFSSVDGPSRRESKASGGTAPVPRGYPRKQPSLLLTADETRPI